MGQDSDFHISSKIIGGILEVEISGEAKKTNSDFIANEIHKSIISTAPAAILLDIRGLKGRFEIVDLYYQVRTFSQKAPILDTAIVGSREYEKQDSFLEITSQNIGLPIRWFTDIDAAREWLGSKSRKEL
jgi:hypothetical protein